MTLIDVQALPRLYSLLKCPDGRHLTMAAALDIPVSFEDMGPNVVAAFRGELRTSRSQVRLGSDEDIHNYVACAQVFWPNRTEKQP